MFGLSRLARGTGIGGAAVLAAAACSPKHHQSTAAAEQSGILGEYDVCVVGGGAVGLAVAREVMGRYPEKSVVVLEKEAGAAAHQTSHNSGVIHAGIYYKPGSTMARCCVRGARMIYEYCEAYGLPVKKTGKLICAPTEADAPVLQDLKATGDANGVEGLEILDAKAIALIEPNVVVHSALSSPNTGIADYARIFRHVAGIIQHADKGEVFYGFEVDNMEKTASGAVAVTGREPGQAGPAKTIVAKNIITAGGLHADNVAKTAGGDSNPAVLTFRGTYYQMKPEFRDICSTNIYPVPSGGGIPVGVHFTPTLDERRGNQMIVGPGACMGFATEAYKFTDVSIVHLWKLAQQIGLWRFVFSNWDLAFTEMYRDLNKNAFLDQARRLIPSVTDDMVEESFAGVMAQIFNDDGTPASDFIFERKMLGGNVLHVRSAPTPACTASFALAEDIVDLAALDFEWEEPAKKQNELSVFFDKASTGNIFTAPK